MQFLGYTGHLYNTPKTQQIGARMNGPLLKRGSALSTVMSWGRARSMCTMLIGREIVIRYSL